MKLMKRNREVIPTRDFRSALDNFFNDFFQEDDFFDTDLQDWAPSVDIKDDGKNFSLKADIPGMDEKDINVEVRDNILTISGKRENKEEHKEGESYRIERSFGSFTRTIPLPDGCDIDKVNAEYKKGVLELTIPHLPQKQPKKISVKTS